MVQHEVAVIKRVTSGRLPKLYPQLQGGVVTLSEDNGASIELQDVTKPYGELFLKGMFANDGAQLPIHVAYPNLFVTAGGKRPILITHGHFFESPWQLTTEIFPKTLGVHKGIALRELEQFNAPVTELGWAALGQAGRMTDRVRYIYEAVGRGQSGPLVAAAREFQAFLDRQLDYGFVKERFTDWLLRKGVSALKDKIEKKDEHRGDNLYVERPENRAKIARYVALSRAQYADLIDPEKAGIASDLVFGHTHVPIRPDHRASVDVVRHGTTHQVRVYNPGGWTEGSKRVAILLLSNGKIGHVPLPC